MDSFTHSWYHSATDIRRTSHAANYNTHDGKKKAERRRHELRVDNAVLVMNHISHSLSCLYVFAFCTEFHADQILSIQSLHLNTLTLEASCHFLPVMNGKNINRFKNISQIQNIQDLCDRLNHKSCSLPEVLLHLLLPKMIVASLHLDICTHWKAPWYEIEALISQITTLVPHSISSMTTG